VILFIAPEIRFEAKTFQVFSLDGQQPFIHGRDSQDFFPVGVFEVEEVLVRDAGTNRIIPWIVVSSRLKKGVILGQPRSIVEYWARFVVGFTLGREESFCQEVTQLPLFSFP
jgi:hypothetical protein